MSDVQTLLNVKVVPGASRDRLVGRLGDAWKVQVRAAPEKGRANDAVVSLLAKALGIKPNQIELVSGSGNPRKQFRISGLEPAEIDRKLAEFS